MAKFVYRKRDGDASFVELDIEDGDELSETQALLVLLDQIDTRLFDIRQELANR